MYIRKSQVKSGSQGEVYYTHRIVESVRTAAGVKQRTLINLGRHFEMTPDLWRLLVKRIEQIVQNHATRAEHPVLFDLTDDIREGN
jgi:hypothetical protein